MCVLRRLVSLYKIRQSSHRHKARHFHMAGWAADAAHRGDMVVEVPTNASSPSSSLSALFALASAKRSLHVNLEFEVFFVEINVAGF